MPRTTSARDADAAERSPFLRLLAEYLWSFCPHLTVSQLAAQTGIPGHMVRGWIKHGEIPQHTGPEPLLSEWQALIGAIVLGVF